MPAAPNLQLPGFVKSDAALQILEARVMAYWIEQRVHLYELQEIGVFLVGLFQPPEGLLMVGPSALLRNHHHRRMQFPNRRDLRRSPAMVKILECHPGYLHGQRLRQFASMLRVQPEAVFRQL